MAGNRNLRIRARNNRAEELATDMLKVGSYISNSTGEAQKALDFLHLLLMESYGKVTGTKI